MLEEHYTAKGQPEEYIKALKKHGYESFIDPMAALFHDLSLSDMEGIIDATE